MHINIRSYTLQASEYANLAMQWQKLEKAADLTFFLSWPWLQAWLEMNDEPVIVIEATQAQNIVGLSLWCERTRKVFGFIPLKQAWLHRTGVPSKDQMWIEYNDFLVVAENKAAIRQAMLNFIKNSDLGWKELVVGLTKAQDLEQIKAVFPVFHELLDSQGHNVDLTLCQGAYRSEVLSKNTRSQINRSIKMLEEMGDLTFKVLDDLADIQASLPDIARLHIQRWRNTDDGSGFENQHFIDFHQSLLSNAPRQAVEVCVLAINDEPIGYLYNYCFEKRVYFYLSALTSHLPSKIKVGMLLHTFAIEHYLQRQFKSYDLLAGDAQYKRSLTNKSYRLFLCSFSVSSPMLAVEHFLKKIKSKIASFLQKRY